MDFDIGNVIYIVATIVAIAVGLLGKKKKPAGTGGAPVESEPEKKKGFFDVIGKEMESFMESKNLYEDLGIDRPGDSEPDYDVESETEDVVSEELESIQAEYEDVQHSGMLSTYDQVISGGQSMTAPLEIIELEEYDESDFFDIDREFDLKSAIIYSAIINKIEY